jgi:hypothetical protein
MARIAVCQTSDNVVVNVILAEVTDPAYPDTQFIEILDGVWCDIGAIWNGTDFTNPNPPPQEEVIEETI